MNGSAVAGSSQPVPSGAEHDLVDAELGVVEELLPRRVAPRRRG